MASFMRHVVCSRAVLYTFDSTTRAPTTSYRRDLLLWNEDNMTSDLGMGRRSSPIFILSSCPDGRTYNKYMRWSIVMLARPANIECAIIVNDQLHHTFHPKYPMMMPIIRRLELSFPSGPRRDQVNQGCCQIVAPPPTTQARITGRNSLHGRMMMFTAGSQIHPFHTEVG